MSTTFAFKVLEIHRRKSGNCGCGKRRTRSRKFWQSMNPFNKNSQGEQKSYGDIIRELIAEADKWQKEPIVCTKCK